MYDLAVIGVGQAGLEAIEIALKNNLSVIAFEKAEIGGRFLNSTTVPIDIISYSAKLLNDFQNCSKVGLNLFSQASFDWQKVLDRKINFVSKFQSEIKEKILDKITLVKSEAEISINYDQVEIYADDNIYQAKNVIIATGSEAVQFSNLDYDGKFIIKPEDLLRLQVLPKKIAIFGTEPSAIEWASILSTLGVQVKIIERADIFAPYLDNELSLKLEKNFLQNNIEIYKNDFIKKVQNDLVILNSEIAFEVDCVMVCLGRKQVLPKINIQGVNEEFKLKPNVDGTCEVENFYVIGDCLNCEFLNFSSSYQAKSVMNKILFNKEIKLKNIPIILKTTPQTASIGLREQDVVGDLDYNIVKVSNSSFEFIKLILKENYIVGVHIFNYNAQDLINMFALIMDKKLTIQELDEIPFGDLCCIDDILKVAR